MGYPAQPSGYGQPQHPPVAQAYGQPDPWANGNVPAQSYDGGDPFDNAMPDARAPRAMLAGPDGTPYLHMGEPVPVSPPSLRTLGVGRLIFIVPKKMERGIKSTFEGAWKPTFDRLTADVIVCDGQGERFGGDPTKGVPDLLGPFPVPCVIADMWIDKDGILEKVPETLIGGGFKIGRIMKVQTKAKRTAWNFNAPDEDPEKAKAIVNSLRPLWAAYLAQQLPILSIETLAERYGVKNVTPPAQPNPVQQPMPQWPPMQPGQAMAPIQQGVQQYPQPVSAPTAPMADDWTLRRTAPTGWEAQWPSLSSAQREQMLAQMGVTAPATAATSAPLAPAVGAYAQGPGY